MPQTTLFFITGTDTIPSALLSVLSSPLTASLPAALSSKPSESRDKNITTKKETKK